MQFELITLTGVKYSAQAYSALLPTADGQIDVLANHEPLMSVLVPGIISIRKNVKDPEQAIEHYASYGGVVEVTKNTTRVLVDEAEHSDEIDQAEAEKAKDRAQQMLSKATTQVEINEAQALLNRQTTRLQVGELRRRQNRR